MNTTPQERAQIELITLTAEAHDRAQAPHSPQNADQLARLADRIAATARTMN